MYHYHLFYTNLQTPSFPAFTTQHPVYTTLPDSNYTCNIQPFHVHTIHDNYDDDDDGGAPDDDGEEIREVMLDRP